MAPTTTHEMKFGRNIAPCVIFLNRGLAISERKIAAAISRMFWVTMNAALYSTCLLYTSRCV